LAGVLSNFSSHTLVASCIASDNLALEFVPAVVADVFFERIERGSVDGEAERLPLVYSSVAL